MAACASSRGLCRRPGAWMRRPSRSADRSASLRPEPRLPCSSLHGRREGSRSRQEGGLSFNSEGKNKARVRLGGETLSLPPQHRVYAWRAKQVGDAMQRLSRPVYCSTTSAAHSSQVCRGRAPILQRVPRRLGGVAQPQRRQVLAQVVPHQDAPPQQRRQPRPHLRQGRRMLPERGRRAADVAPPPALLLGQLLCSSMGNKRAAAVTPGCAGPRCCKHLCGGLRCMREGPTASQTPRQQRKCPAAAAGMQHGAGRQAAQQQGRRASAGEGGGAHPAGCSAHTAAPAPQRPRRTPRRAG